MPECARRSDQGTILKLRVLDLERLPALSTATATRRYGPTLRRRPPTRPVKRTLFRPALPEWLNVPRTLL
jgi:hypothetical protein